MGVGGTLRQGPRTGKGETNWLKRRSYIGAMMLDMIVMTLEKSAG